MNHPHIDSPAHPPRKPRLLWANVYCLLDSSSGASMSVRQMLLQLVQQGYEVSIVGATVFDHERGKVGLMEKWPQVRQGSTRLVTLADGPLKHRLYVTASTQRGLMTCQEEGEWFFLYQHALAQFRPDVVFYFGGKPLDLLIPAEARARGIPAVFYLVNGNYTHSRWCRDVDLVLTDTCATAQHYADKLGLPVTPVGAFVDPSRVLAPPAARDRILFINPTLEKGVGVVIRLAMLLEQRRPDIVFEVVESRGKWGDVLRSVSGAIGQPRESLANVVVTPNSADMRPIYARARLLLAPSLWWESGARVVVEAMLNGIPAIITDHGGMAELMQDGGIVLKLDPTYHQKPYGRVPSAELLEPLLKRIEALFDDETRYDKLAARARHVGQTLHSLQTSTQRLLQALQPFVVQRAGDADADAALRACHKQSLNSNPTVASTHNPA